MLQMLKKEAATQGSVKVQPHTSNEIQSVSPMESSKVSTLIQPKCLGDSRAVIPSWAEVIAALPEKVGKSTPQEMPALSPSETLKPGFSFSTSLKCLERVLLADPEDFVRVRLLCSLFTL